MKKLLSFLPILLIFSATIAQAPQKFRYQGIARGANGNPLSNHAVSFRVSILQGNPSGTVRYRETFTGSTNEFGAFTVSIGSGNPELGSLSGIQWGNDNFFQEVEMDTTGTNSNYNVMGISQLLSVPYALFAANGGFSHYQVFNNSGTFNVPDGVAKVMVEIWGAGGGGGGGGGGGNNGGTFGGTGGGGGGGGYLKDILSVTPGGTLPVNVGVGGSGGTGGAAGGFNTAGGNGNTATGGGYSSVNTDNAFGGSPGGGGYGGPAGNGGAPGGFGGNGGNAPGPIGQTGQFGQSGSGSGNGLVSGYGGNAAGGGGFGGNPGGDKTPGGGGSGGQGQGGGGNSGTSGGDGRVIIWW